MIDYNYIMSLNSFEERLEVLREEQANFDRLHKGRRAIGQEFYSSPTWQQLRNDIIIRDKGCDLGDPEKSIDDERPIIHHICPLTDEDIINGSFKMVDPNNLILTTLRTHNAIHYGTDPQKYCFEERKPGDTIMWNKKW